LKVATVSATTLLFSKSPSFSQFDLLESQMTSPPDSIFGGFDIIICANVLFYFNELTRNQILKKIISASEKNGIFITGEVERDYFLKLNFVEVFPQSSIFQMPKYFKL
jgi:chemotaxis methyl-accepting protein methylase